MKASFRSATYLIALLAVTSTMVVDADVALAQYNACSKLNTTLRSLDRNRDYRAGNRNTAALQSKQKEVKAQESRFVRGGCQKVLNAGKKLSGACRILARTILRGRSDVDKLKASVSTAQAVSQQRQQVLQKIASLGCATKSSNSRVTVTTRQDNRRQPRSLFDLLFGTGEYRADDEFGMLTGLATVRTVCVRSCDGYFWPISFSTTQEYLNQDAGRCRAEANGADVQLYYYRNPGETAEDMISMSGRAYKSSPNAFRYKEEFDQTCSTKRKIDFGSVSMLASADGGASRMMISFNELKFPMPLRDPRRVQITTIAEIITIALPRPRPVREGEEKPQVQTAGTPTNHDQLRTFSSEGKTVRIVGPDTPYAQSEEAGT